MQLWKAFPGLLLILFPVFSFNHPEIHWKTVTTEHFSINYYDKTEPSLYAAWKIAEETYTALAPLFDYKFRNRIDLSLADYDDYSNGWADYTSSAIMIWIPDSRFEYRGNTTWLRNVISHEITHLLSLESKKKTQMMDIMVNLQATSPNEKLLIQEPFVRITPWPNWFAEGMAQRGSEKMGHDSWDSRREMLLRTAAMSKTLLTLDEMGNFSHDQRGNEMVYNQGFSFVKFLENRIGINEIAAIFKAGTEQKINLQSYFAERTGKTLDSFYAEWKDSLNSYYSVKFTAADTNEHVVYQRGLVNSLPQISPDGKLWGWLASGNDDNGQTDLIVCENGTTDVKYRIRYAHTSWSFSKDSKKVYFVKSRDPDKHGSYLNDLFVFDIGSRQTARLTEGLRVYDIAVSAMSGALSVVTFDKGAFSVSLLDEKTGQARVIFKGAQGEPYVKCSWSTTDSSLLAVEKIINGKSRIYIQSVKDSSVRELTSGKVSEESPFWAADGRVYFSADYEGVYNIYSINSDGSDLRRYTSATGGCFTPYAGSDKKIMYSGYMINGFTVAQTGGDGSGYGIPSDSTCTFKPLPQPKGKVTITAAPYKAHYGRALSELQLIGIVDQNNGYLIGHEDDTLTETVFSFGAALLSSRTDPLQKKSKTIGMALAVEGYSSESDSGENNNIRKVIDNAKNKINVSQSVLSNLKLNNKTAHSEIFKSNKREHNLNLMLSKGASGSDSTDSSSSTALIPVLEPFFRLTNSEFAPTIQFDIAAYMAMMILPVAVQFSLTSEWNLTRNSSLGTGIESAVYPFSGIAAGAVPVSYAWSNVGLYNEDIQYNYADVSQFTFSGGAEFVPVTTITEYSDDISDTTTAVYGGLFARSHFFHGFPVGKYASLQFDIEGRIDFYDARLETDILDGESKTYLQTVTGLKFVFPIVRNINSGLNYYFDGFYGSIGYSLCGDVNREFFELDHYSRDLFTDTSYTGTAQVGHQISASLVLGHYKSNLFFKQFVIDVNYELLREKVYLKIASEF